MSVESLAQQVAYVDVLSETDSFGLIAQALETGWSPEIVKRLLDRSADQLVHVELDRVSPLAVPVMVVIGRETTPQGSVDDELLLEAESLAGAAMRVDGPLEGEG